MKGVFHGWPKPSDMSAKALCGLHHSLCVCLGSGTGPCLGNLSGNGGVFPRALSLGGSWALDGAQSQRPGGLQRPCQVRPWGRHRIDCNCNGGRALSELSVQRQWESCF